MPLSIKCLFYPIALAVLLELLGLRVDILITLIISVMLTVLKFDRFIIWLSVKIDRRLASEKAASLRVVPTASSNPHGAQIDKIKTSHTLE